VVDAIYDCKSEVIGPGAYRFKAEIGKLDIERQTGAFWQGLEDQSSLFLQSCSMFNIVFYKLVKNAIETFGTLIVERGDV
jgi:hypothetical protein